MQRFDFFNIKAVKTDEGFIRDTPVIGRTGLLEYQNADGSKRIEYRPPEEAFNIDSLASIESKPVTLGHVAMVTSKNAKKVKPIGAVLSAGRQDGDNIVADIVIYDDLPSDRRELSCGYTVDLDETPGVTPDGQHYDAIQRNIRYNHLAVVHRGRAGNARLNLDSVGNQIEEVMQKMAKVKLDTGIEYEVPEEVKVAYDSMVTKLKEEKKAKDVAVAAADVAKEELSKAKEDVAKAKKDAKDNFDEAVKVRIDMLSVANKYEIKNAENMDNADIMKAVIKAVHGDSIKLDGKSDDYVQAVFDMAKEVAVEHKDSVKEQNKAMNSGRIDSSNEDEYDVAKAYEKLKADEAELYLKEVK